MNITTKCILLLFPCFVGLSLRAQFVIWYEDFNNGCTAACPGESYSGPNGSWDQFITGAEGANPNMFYVSCAENNNGLGSCSSACSSNPNPTMHVSAQVGNAFCPNDCGAEYNSGGLCGFAPPAGSCPLTSKRIQSPFINLTGYANMALDFQYIEGGVGNIDNMRVWYYDANVNDWFILSDPAKTTNTNCSSNNGTWSYDSIPLPAVANNNANFRIGFEWKNNDDGNGTNPSFAIDNIRIVIPSNGPPNASFTASETIICAGECINFLNNSTYASGATFNWNFGATIPASTAFNPVGICFPTPGVYTVTLTVTDVFGTDVSTLTNYIYVGPGPNAGNDATGSVCNNSGIDLNSLLSGAGSGGTWQETTPIPSGQFVSSSGYFDATNLFPGAYTFSYTVQGTGTCSNSDVANFVVNVTTCSGPIAEVSATLTNICLGQAIVFSSASTGVGINSYSWNFTNGTPSTFSGPGPISIVYNSTGSFPVTLTVVSPSGTDSHTINVTVSACNAPNAQFELPVSLICPGDCIDPVNLTVTSGPSTYVWTFAGGTPTTANTPDPGTICYEEPGTYQISLYVSNESGTDIYNLPITVSQAPNLTVSNDTTIEVNGTANIVAITTTGDVDWSWSPNSQGDIIDCLNEDCTQIIVTPLVSTILTATVSTPAGCSLSEQVYISIENNDGIGVPNSFSPNGDGENDVLYVKGSSILEMDFRVYNRYGELVFISTNPTIGWDGRYKTREERDATFVYVLRYELMDGRSGSLNGNVTLIR